MLLGFALVATLSVSPTFLPRDIPRVEQALEVVVAAQAAAPEPVVEEHHHHPEPEPEPALDSVWFALAECESNGEWDYGPHSGWGSGVYHGGLQFHPSTWNSYRPADFPPYAYLATPAQQIAVAERVLADQGWSAWPACSSKLGLR